LWQARPALWPITGGLFKRQGKPSHCERQLKLRRNQTSPSPRALTMLRQYMIRSLKRPAYRAALNGSRAFTASARRPAEVELTIGSCHFPLRARTYANHLCRWQEGINRRYEDDSDPLTSPHTLLTRPNSRCGSHPSLRKGRSYSPEILLPREVDDCWKLSYVLG
jgi:hypothetical protein